MQNVAPLVFALVIGAGRDEAPELTELRPISYVDRLLPSLTRYYGIRSRDDLRAALTGGGMHRPRDDGWLAGMIGDVPRRLEIYEKMRAENPADPEAIMQAAWAKIRLGRDREALRDLEEVRHRVTWSQDPRDGYGEAALLAQLCRLQRTLGNLERARQECLAAIKAGSAAPATRTLAKILVSMNDPAGALELAERSIRAMPTASAWYAKAVALEALDRRSEAQEAFKSALRVDPFYTPAEWALEIKSNSPASRLQQETGWQALSDAEWTGRCGHVYLELKMPDRADRCFAEANRFDHGLAAAERLYHLAETEPTRALDSAEAVPAGQRHRLLWWLIASIHHLQGRDAAARPALEQALDKDPRYAKGHRLYAEVCEALHETECARHHRAVMAGEPGR